MLISKKSENVSLNVPVLLEIQSTFLLVTFQSCGDQVYASKCMLGVLAGVWDIVSGWCWSQRPSRGQLTLAVLRK